MENELDDAVHEAKAEEASAINNEGPEAQRKYLSLEPTLKAPAIEGLLTSLTGKNRVDTIHAGKCTTCDAPRDTVVVFLDELSRKEYTISGMCQKCQDKVFT